MFVIVNPISVIARSAATKQSRKSYPL